MSLDALLNVAKKAAYEAGQEVLQVYHSGDYQAFTKADKSPVTTADFRANEVICHRLMEATPGIPIMSEEQNNGELSERQHWQRYWLIDPIDGTQEFVARSGDFAINISLIENNQPVIGVIYWPIGDTLYFARESGGAFKQAEGQVEPIGVRRLRDPAESKVIIAISRRQAREKVMNSLSSDRRYQTLPLGSCSLKACYIAEGKADVFLRVGVTGEWDTGAPQCIVAEAGGQVLAANFKPLTYNQRNSLINPDFVVLGDPSVDWQQIIQHNIEDSYEDS